MASDKHSFSDEELKRFAGEVSDEKDVLYGLLSFRGSIAHGTYIPSDNPNSIDDIDLIGFTIPNIEYFFGLRQWGSRGTKEIKRGPLDVVLYEVRKMVGLLANGNPNVLHTLFIEEDFILKSHKVYSILRDNRDAFLSQDLYHPFIGYAHSQLKRMEAFSFEGYMGEKRKRLVESVGYDCKNASHLVRLLRMGKELLEDGEMHVYRGGIDAEELVDIKTGKWRIEDVKSEAGRLFEEIKHAKYHTSLPEHVEMDRINAICTTIVSEAMCNSELWVSPNSS